MARRRKKAKKAEKEKEKEKGQAEKEEKGNKEDKKGKTNFNTTLTMQKHVVAVKARVHATAKPGMPVPYVDAKGGLMKAVSAGEQRRRDTEAAQAVRDAVRSSQASKKRKLFAGPGASLVPSAHFEIVNFKHADTVVVDNLAVRAFDDATLCASLWGKALCDNEWVRCGGKHGTCFQHVECGGMDQPSRQIYLSPAFERDRKALSDQLVKAATAHDLRDIRRPDGKKLTKPIFRVIGGAPPDVGPVAVRCFYVVSEAEFKTECAKKRRRITIVSVEGLAFELGAGATRL